MTDHLALLLKLHDGDDRCGCLREALEMALDGAGESEVAELIEHCLQEHPSGSRYPC